MSNVCGLLSVQGHRAWGGRAGCQATIGCLHVLVTLRMQASPWYSGMAGMSRSRGPLALLVPWGRDIVPFTHLETWLRRTTP